MITVYAERRPLVKVCEECEMEDTQDAGLVKHVTIIIAGRDMTVNLCRACLADVVSVANVIVKEFED